MSENLIIAADSGMMDQVWLYVLPLVGSIMLTYAIFSLVRDLRKPDNRRVQDRLREKGGGFDGDAATEKAVKASILRQRKEAQSIIAQALSKLSVIGGLQRMLDQANLNFGATTVLINLTGLASIGYIACYFLKMDMWISITAAAGLFFLPLLVVFFIRKIRLNKFLNQLPDVFELMSQALRAGHSLPNAILVISQQLSDPVRSEFARVFHEQNLGIKIEESLKNMAKRIGMMDVNFFVTAVCIQRQTGGDLAEVLDNISGVIRERIKLFGMVKALTAEGRLSGWVLLALPIVVFILELVVNPNYANKLLETEIGNYMLITGAVMQLLGLAMIQKIVNIKV
ncbi:MAG: type II secretion system F family protein [Planctomycetes bacterium]|nr:type II secretion system F family protein [Planctomycetota bacterium]